MIVAGATAILTRAARRARRVRVQPLPLQGPADRDAVAAADPDVPAVAARRRDLPDRAARPATCSGVIGLNTRTGLILVYLGGALGVNTWLMKGFFDTIPAELDESARVDGATPAQIFWGVILPLAAPVLAVVGLLSFIVAINEFVIASVLLQTQDKFTLAGRPVRLHRPAVLGALGRRSPPASLLAAIPVVAPLPRSSSVHRPRAHRRRGQGMSVDRARAAARRCSREPHHDGSDVVRPRAAGRARRRGGRARARARRARPTTSSCATSATASRAGSRRRSTARRRRRRGGARRFPVGNPSTSVPLAPRRRRRRLRWLNGIGRARRTTSPDADDFVLVARRRARPGTSTSVVYQIFPDRFATPRARRRRRPTGRSRATGTSCRPGAGRTRRASGSAATCAGSRQHLDHIESLGVNVLYLTPIFPAGSTHRYDATTFDRVDPLLGGDEALALARSRAAHARGMRVLGDLTTNHIGNGHEWFVDARATATRPSAASTSSTSRSRPATSPGSACRPCRSSTGARPSCARGWSAVARRWLERRRSTAGASTSRT